MASKLDSIVKLQSLNKRNTAFACEVIDGPIIHSTMKPCKRPGAYHHCMECAFYVEQKTPMRELIAIQEAIHDT